MAAGSIGAETVRSTTTNPAASATATARAANVAGDVKPCCWPLLRPKIRAPSDAVINKAPATSRRWPPADRAPGSQRTNSSMRAMMGGLTRNTAGQPRY
jgi:hypothetical protein